MNNSINPTRIIRKKKNVPRTQIRLKLVKEVIDEKKSNTIIKKTNLNINQKKKILHAIYFLIYNSNLVAFFNKRRNRSKILQSEKMPICNFFLKIMRIGNIRNWKKVLKIITEDSFLFNNNIAYRVNDYIFELIKMLNDEERQFLKSNYVIEPIEKIKFIDYYKFIKETENTFIFNTFCWFEKVLVECLECKEIKKYFQHFLTYDINLKKCINKTLFDDNLVLSINDCIKYISENERIYNCFCGICEKKTVCEKKSFFRSVQTCLIILLKDIENTEIVDKIQKYNIKIQVNENLEIKDYSKKSKSSFKFKIKGLIYYNSDSKEYITYCFNPKESKWYVHKDMSINQVELFDFIDSYDFKIFPYTLLYISEK